MSRANCRVESQFNALIAQFLRRNSTACGFVCLSKGPFSKEVAVQFQEHHPGIRIDHISVDGGGGLIFALGMMAIVLAAFPALQPIVGACFVLGVLTALVLHRLWY